MSAPAGLPPRLLAVLVPVCAAGAADLALRRVLRSPHAALTPVERSSGSAALLAASMFAERFPVPVEGADAGGVSLLYVFVVATMVLFGWEAGALLAAIGTLTQLLQHRPAMRVAYNAAVFGGAAALAGLSIEWLDTQTRRRARSLAVARGVRRLLGQPAPDHARRRGPLEAFASRHSCARTHGGTVIPFALMASAALMLVVLWQRSRDPLRRARRAAARDLALPALDVPRAARDAARADRSADRARQPPPLPRAAAARARRGRTRRRLRSACASSTSTTSSRSTTSTATRPATAFSPRSRRGCARAARRSVSAATSSPSCCPTRREEAALETATSIVERLR